MSPKEKLLVADDNPVNINVLRDALEPHGYEILAALFAPHDLAEPAEVSCKTFLTAD